MRKASKHKSLTQGNLALTLDEHKLLEDRYNWDNGLPVLWQNIGDKAIAFRVGSDRHFIESKACVLIPDLFTDVLTRKNLPLEQVPPERDPVYQSILAEKRREKNAI